MTRIESAKHLEEKEDKEDKKSKDKDRPKGSRRSSDHKDDSKPDYKTLRKDTNDKDGKKTEDLENKLYWWTFE